MAENRRLKDILFKMYSIYNLGKKTKIVNDFKLRFQWIIFPRMTWILIISNPLANLFLCSKMDKVCTLTNQKYRSLLILKRQVKVVKIIVLLSPPVLTWVKWETVWILANTMIWIFGFMKIKRMLSYRNNSM